MLRYTALQKNFLKSKSQKCSHWDSFGRKHLFSFFNTVVFRIYTAVYSVCLKSTDRMRWRFGADESGTFLTAVVSWIFLAHLLFELVREVSQWLFFTLFTVVGVLKKKNQFSYGQTDFSFTPMDASKCFRYLLMFASVNTHKLLEPSSKKHHDLPVTSCSRNLPDKPFSSLFLFFSAWILKFDIFFHP